MKKETFYIEVGRLVPGLFVDLELAWSQHPFLFPRFRLKNTREIRQIRNLGLTRVRVIGKKSQADALKALTTAPPLVPDEDQSEADTVLDDLWQQKKDSLAQAEAFKKEHRRTAKAYRETQKRIGSVTRNLKLAPANAIHDAGEVITDITEMLAQTGSLVVSMVNLSSDEFSSQHHALNVTVLALAMGKHLNLSEQELHDLGVGCMLHDIGKAMVPAPLLQKPSLTDTESQVVMGHVGHGLKMLNRVDIVTDAVQEMVAHHHAYLDGSGHPATSDAEDISKLCRILQIANHYDNLCNPATSATPLSPKAAMAKLFSDYETRLDSQLIHQFVRHFGVYPPGTVVQMSDDSIAVVISVSSEALLSPRVLIYNPDIPAKQALMIDLTDNQDIVIRHALKPGEYPIEVQEYLGLDDRLGYFIGSSTSG